MGELTRAYGTAQCLPTYETLASLPFDYAISFNFDESFEHSLSRAGKSVSLVITDQDVPLSRRSSTTVVKPHGTSSRPETLRATRKQVGDFDTECPLIRSLLHTLIACGALLFVGYGLGDEDIMGAVRRVRSWSGRSYRRWTSILRSAPAAMRAELDEYEIDVIEGDATSTLDVISVSYVSRGQREPQDSERWRSHPFFRDLVNSRTTDRNSGN